ncbi:discoidin domain-containing protein [uncultured Aquimarina sp.]|uniref:discoidin domain-containing protein n=1 Tax=uncultured Aquimarina sp. TaxID=575652 RepID=UPI0026300392|nr:discoidin domain-containing protein [uncultured Aquimarina sp.]
MKNLSLLLLLLTVSNGLFSQVNIALNKPTVVDSQFDNSFPGSNAVDGGIATNPSRWVSSSAAWPHWMEVNLEGNHEINQIKFWTGHSGTYNEGVQYLFQYWDGSNWITIVDGSDNISGIVDQTFNVVSTSKVRLYGLGSNRDNLFRLYEIEVYGTLVDTETDPNTATDPSNVFVGTDAGQNNTTGVNNVFVGNNSGRKNTVGKTNVFVGRNSGRNNVEGSNNVFNGNSAGFSNVSGNFNTFLGTFAGRENIDGRRNVFIGGNAGRNSTGNANILIGYKAGFNETGNNKLIIENSDSDTPLVYGDFATDQFGINTNTIPDGYNFAVGGGASFNGDIVSTGRISIGTTEDDPGYALTVKGKVHVQEVKVDLLGVIAPDYVFYEDYKLKTLKEVAKYIYQEGHLPNIPSAAEMKKEGVNLKEMNMKLLEKVEELTLYTIAQEKAIKQQQEANDTLEKRLEKLEELLKK